MWEGGVAQGGLVLPLPWHAMAWHAMAQHAMSCHGMPCHSTAWPARGMTCYGASCQATAWSGQGPATTIEHQITKFATAQLRFFKLLGDASSLGIVLG